MEIPLEMTSSEDLEEGLVALETEPVQALIIFRAHPEAVGLEEVPAPQSLERQLLSKPGLLYSLGMGKESQ